MVGYPDGMAASVCMRNIGHYNGKLLADTMQEWQRR
jgi:hypothetical protein